MKDRIQLYDIAAKELHAADLAKIKHQIHNAKKDAAIFSGILLFTLMVISALLYWPPLNF